ncbi:MAG: hypothetical protein ABJB11_14165 [Ferruginibacter sp.]
MTTKQSAFFVLSAITFLGCKQPELQQFTDVSESSSISFANNWTSNQIMEDLRRIFEH